MDKIDLLMKEVKYVFLPPQFIVKRFIRGKDAPSCNYEEYLAELLDESKYFRARTGGEHITLVERQNKGQPDIDCNGFTLDFKIIGGQSAITAYRHTYASITHLSGGGVAYGKADGKQKGYDAVRIHLAARGYSCDDLMNLRKKYKNDDIVKRDVVSLLNNLEVNKNLLLFLPYAILIDHLDERKSMEDLKTILRDSFHSLLEYRNKTVPGKETFLCCICNQKMVFYKCHTAEFELIDKVDMYRSGTFCKLASYCYLDRKIIDAIVGWDYV